MKDILCIFALISSVYRFCGKPQSSRPIWTILRLFVLEVLTQVKKGSPIVSPGIILGMSFLSGSVLMVRRSGNIAGQLTIIKEGTVSVSLLH